MNPQQCLRHQLNNSRTKTSYKFGKGKRFFEQKLLTNSMYDLPDNNNQRTCGFGYGTRSNLEKRNPTPSPQKYKMNSSINLNKGKSFKNGRDSSSFGSFLMKSIKDNEMPGPNKYELSSTLNKKYTTLKKRLPSQLDKKIGRDEPGPTHYYLQSMMINKDGKYPFSHQRNVKNIYLGSRYDTRIKTQYNTGPGSYQIPSSISIDQRKTKNGFGYAKRKNPEDHSKKHMPGPGVYETFSEFSCIQK